MKKYFFVSAILILLFLSCENKKSQKKEKGSLIIQQEISNMAVTPSAEHNLTEQKEQGKKSKIKVTFIELGSVRCIPCKMMMPIMKEIEEKYGDEVKVIFYDVWTEAGRPYAEKYQIRAIPTQVFLDENGKEFFRHVGFFPREQLFEVLKKKGVNIK